MDKKAIIITGIYFVITFIVIYLLFRLVNRYKKKHNLPMMEVLILINHYHLDPKKIKVQKIIRNTSFINAFIISFVSNLVFLIPLKMVWQFAIGFLLLAILIYAIYEIYGRILNKKWGIKK